MLAHLPLPRPKESHQLTTFDLKTRSKTRRVNRGERVTIGEVEGCGYIAKLWMTFPGWFWQHWNPAQPISQTILKTLILRISFDGVEQVAAPISDLCGAGLGEIANFTAKTFGMSSGGFYLAFPMPFHRSFRIEVENLDETIDTDVFMNVLYQTVDALPDDTPTFHAQFRTGSNPGSEPLLVAEASGAGRFSGCTLTCQGLEPTYLSYLEAPEHVYFRDETTPRIVGTGLEDYFLGGWYFREGTFTGELHGVPIKDTLNASVAMYRVHDLDAIFFDDGLRFQFETPWNPAQLRPFVYSTVGFLYLDTPQSAPPIRSREELLCFPRVRNTDRLSVP